MLPEDMTHPRQGRRNADRWATFFLFVGGLVFLGAGVSIAVAMAGKEFGLIEGEPGVRSALLSLFFALSAAECFTTNITRWAGEVLRAIAGKFGNKVVGE